MRLLAALAAVLAALTAPALAADLSAFAKWDETSTAKVDHAAWGAFLSRYVRAPAAKGEPARVAYGAVTPADKAALAAYVDAVQKVRPSGLRRDEAFVYWVNLYNAATVKLIVDRYPVKSITAIKSGLVSFGPWDGAAATVEGVRLSYNDIEHKILRASFKDNRVHYALNCASLGCPDLKATPWATATLGADLDAAAKAYINSPRGVRIEKGRLVASSIYKWFGEDFGGDDPGRLAHFRRYAEAPLAASLSKRTKIDGYAYDWALNDAR